MTGRNLPCPCGSRLKYKGCCGKPAALAPAPPRQVLNGPAIMCLLPTRGAISVETVQSLSRTDRLTVMLQGVARKPVDIARNELASITRSAIKTAPFTPLGGWFILWIDDDAWWRAGTLLRAVQALYEHPEIDLLAGWFGPRSPKSCPAVRREDGSWPRPGVDCQWGDIVEIARTGFHFVLHRAALFDAMPSEPFTLEEGDEAEDFAFCRRAREAGKRLWVHTGLEIAHIDADGLAYLPGEPAFVVAGAELLKTEQPEAHTYGAAVDSRVTA